MTRSPLRLVGPLLMVAASAQAFVLVTPRTATLLGGGSRAFRVLAANQGSNTGPTVEAPAEDWTWQVLEGGVGTIEPSTGVYAAPEVASPSPVTVRATFRHDPDTRAEVAFLVMPSEPFKLMASVLGEDCLDSFSTRLPDPLTESLFDPRTRTGLPQWRKGRDLLVGYGLPFTVQWRPQGTRTQLLTYGLGHDLVRREVTGETRRVITPTDRMRALTVESLQRADDDSKWDSMLEHFSIHLRGVVPHAGNPLVEPDHRDGCGSSARFREPFGLAVIPGLGASPWKAQACLVTDPQSHVIRLISPTGEVSSPWGTPDVSGHRDAPRPSLLRRAASALCCANRQHGQASQARFNGPTFLTIREGRLPSGRRTWVARVADSGNHVIREVHPDGTVTTLAGSPGCAGHQDSFLGLAFSTRFNRPQGLAEDDRGNLYVADQGNCVIRVITPQGRVRTLAGRPGVAGRADGPAHIARFTRLRGLAIHPWPGQRPALYAVDGHAIRRIDLEDGQVTTVAGAVATPGFRDVQDGTREQRQAAILEPCLNNPCGLVSSSGILLVADQGNHALRQCWTGEPRLVTLAGDPGLAETRWGLLRDGMQAGLDERFAGLEAPRGIAACQDRPEAFFVAAGSCVAEVLPSRHGRDRLAITALACPLPVRAQEPCGVRVTLATTTQAEQQSNRQVSCTADFLDPDGTLVERKRGEGESSAPIEITGAFTQPGQGAVLIRCTTDQGISTGARLEVDIAN